MDGPSALSMVDEGRAGVIAKIGNFQVAGQSGRAQETSGAIKATVEPFHGRLASLPELEGRSIFACAEPNALANLLRQYKGPNKSLSNIRFATTIRDSSERLALCKNCQQWLEPSASALEFGLYQIKKELLAKPKPRPDPESDPDKRYDRDFPAASMGAPSKGKK